MHADDLVLEDAHPDGHRRVRLLVEFVDVRHHEDQRVLHVHQVREQRVLVRHRKRQVRLKGPQVRLRRLQLKFHRLILVEGDHRLVILGKQLLQVVRLFPRILQHGGQVGQLLPELRDLALLLLMLLFELDVREIESVVLGYEFGDLVLEGVHHGIVEFLLAFELLDEVLVQLPVVAAAGAVGLGHGGVSVVLLLDGGGVGDQAVPEECLRARFLRFLLQEEVEGIGLLIDQVLLEGPDTLLQSLLGLFVLIYLLQEEVPLGGETCLVEVQD